MIIERLKKLIEDKLNRKAERERYVICFAILKEISDFFEDHPTENKVFFSSLATDKFDEVYAMELDIGKPYIIKKIFGKHYVCLEVTRRVEYRPELYY